MGRVSAECLEAGFSGVRHACAALLYRLSACSSTDKVAAPVGAAGNTSGSALTNTDTAPAAGNPAGGLIQTNTAKEGAGAIFFVSNDRTGSLVIKDSKLSHNPSAGFETVGYPGIFVLAKGDPQIDSSTLE